MAIYGALILTCWLVLLGYWTISAFGIKRTIGGPGWRTHAYVRIAILVIVLLILRVPAGQHLFRSGVAHFARGGYGPLFADPVMRAIGVAICAGGVGLAIWARIHIGRNWGMPMSLKENPELVTSGPYSHIRHPIYTGFLSAMLGSALTASSFWLIPLVIFGGYFIYSATREEKIMTRQFPGAYPDYRKRTRMLIPFVL